VRQFVEAGARVVAIGSALEDPSQWDEIRALHILTS